jgi:hypothetical protein
MSIRGELNKSADYLRNARKAILDRGGEISLTAGLKDLPEAIYKIPADASLAFQSDDSVAYRKIVPATAEEYAQIAKIGGMTHKSKNRFFITHIDDYDNLVSKQTDSSIELTIPAGTSDAYVDVIMDLSLLGTTPHTFTVYGLPNDIECCIWYDWYNEDDDWIYDDRVYPGGRWFYPAEVYSQAFVEITGITASEDRHLTLKFMLNEDSNASYTPYFEGLRDTKVTELVSEGAQLIPFPFLYQEPQTINGVTWTPNADGSITANGTQEKSYNFDLFYDTQNPILLNGTYTASLRADLASGCTFYLSSKDGLGNVTLVDSTGSKATDIVNREFFAIRFWINVGTTFDNVTFYPMLNRGSTAAPYKPYRADAVDTLAIAEEIRAIEGYGIGKSDTKYNYIDLERKIFKQDYAKIRLLSTMGNYNAGSDWYYIAYSHLGIAPTDRSVLCNLLPSVDITANKTSYGIYHTYSLSHVVIRIQGFTTAEEYKQWLADNEVYIIEKLAEPIEVDISAYLKDGITFLKVEGGGPITAVNEREQAVPSTINYIAKVGG